MESINAVANDAGKEHMSERQDGHDNGAKVSLSQRAPAGHTTTKTTRYSSALQAGADLGVTAHVGIEWTRETEVSHVQCIRSKTEFNITVGPPPVAHTIEHLGDEESSGLPGGAVSASISFQLEPSARVNAVYVTIGIFRRGHTVNPHESIVMITDRGQFFRQLHWGTLRLRGVTGTFLSLRHIKGFKLYRCNPKQGTHARVELDSNGVTDLKLLLDNYNKWRVPDSVSRSWADWVEQTLNKGSLDVLKGEYSLELVLDWSATRITIVVFLPVLLSLVIGIWLNSKDWTDLATIQTAWGTASYIVTAGGITAALLGILSTIGDK